MKSSAVYGLALTFALAPFAVLAADDIDSKAGFSITPSVGFISPENKKDLDNGPVLSLGAGYRFGANWEVEAAYLDSNLEGDSRGDDAQLDGYHVDAIYNFTNDKIQPYVSLGFGELNYDYDNAENLDEDPYNVGVGVKWFLSPSWAVRSEVRGFHDSDTDMTFSVGLQRLFGQSSPAPLDDDGDGVRNDLDKCPNTPKGVQVDADGCPLDSDGDGVPDYLDQCPDTEAGYKVDAKGCYQELAEAVSIVLKVEFAFDSDKVEEQYKSEIAQVAGFLREYHGTTADIEGHTDGIGSEEYNQNLSQRRAKAVVNVLANDFDVDPARLKAEGYGESQPVADNATEEGRAQNRRVVSEIKSEIVIRVKK